MVVGAAAGVVGVVLVGGLHFVCRVRYVVVSGVSVGGYCLGTFLVLSCLQGVRCGRCVVVWWGLG